MGHEIKPERLFAKYSTYEVKDLELPLQVTVTSVLIMNKGMPHNVFFAGASQMGARRPGNKKSFSIYHLTNASLTL